MQGWMLTLLTEGISSKAQFRRIVLPLAVAETLIWAAFYYIFPALLLTWEQDLGWSKTELAGAFTLCLISSALSAPLAGRIIDHGRGRELFVGSAAFGCVLMFGLCLVQHMWQFYVIWVLMGTVMSCCLYEPCFAILTRAMGPKAKRAITWVTLVAGFAGTVSFPSAHILVEWSGWRMAVGMLAGMVLLVAVPLAWRALSVAAKHSIVHAAPASKRASEITALLQRPTFWLLAIAFAFPALNHSALITHLLALLDERGVAAETAVLAASMIGPMQVAGRIAMIAAERYVSTTVIAMACFISVLGASLALLGAVAVPSLLFVFVVLQGAGWGTVSIVKPVIIAELLGRKNFGLVSGLTAVPFMLAIAIAPTCAAVGWLFGGYELVIWFAAALTALGLIAFVGALVAHRDET